MTEPTFFFQLVQYDQVAVYEIRTRRDELIAEVGLYDNAELITSLLNQADAMGRTVASLANGA